MSAKENQAPRDYGGWRLRRGIGLLGLGLGGTAAVLGALLVLVITAAASPAALLYVAPPLLFCGGAGLTRIGGEPLALAALRRARWRHASSRGWTRYQAEAAAAHSSAWRLPGVLAPLALLDADDGYGGRYALVLDRRAGTLTAALRVIPASTWLADRHDADGWVANWGGWLASLGYLPMVRHVTVVTDTAPEPGTALADAVAAALDPPRRLLPGRSWASWWPPPRPPPPTSTPGSPSRSTRACRRRRRPGWRRPPPRPAGPCTAWSPRWAPAG